jgi:hypothetical protein
MSQFGKMNATQRAKLKKSDAAGYEKLRVEHARARNGLEQRVEAAKAEGPVAYWEARLELVRFNADDFATGITAAEVEKTEKLLASARERASE